jgi:hypothetical protein
MIDYSKNRAVILKSGRFKSIREGNEIMLKRISVLVALVGGFLVMALSVLPTGTAYACLPCACPDNTSINCWGPYQIYTDPDESGNCTISIWIVEADGQGKETLTLTAEDITELPAAEAIDKYVLLDDALNGYVSLYKLQNGQFQVNVGPDGEGKVYVTNWTGCPAEDVHEDNFRVG